MLTGGKKPRYTCLVDKIMGKKTYFINGKYYIIDDETGEIKSVTINDNQNIPVDDLKQLIKILATEEK